MHCVTKNVATNFGQSAASKQPKGYRLPDQIATIDLSIFEDPFKSECIPPSDDQLLTECCSHLLRLCTASKYHDALTLSSKVDEEMKATLFIEFSEQVYLSALDDAAHLIKEHSNDIGRVHEEWTERYGLPKCTVSDCAKTARHYGRGNRKRERTGGSGNEEALYEFYESLYDRVHNFVAHLYDLGMRVDASSLTQSEGGGDEKEAESEGVAVDQWFAAERDHIKKRKKELNLDSERMDPENTKFTIQTVAEQQGLTLTDALFEELAENEKVHRETLQRLHLFSVQNAFDSDAVELDLENVADSNLCPLINSQSVAETMSNFIHSINCTLSLSLSLSMCSLSISSLSVHAQCAAARLRPDLSLNTKTKTAKCS